jgi:hypothetical protein
MNVNSFNTGKYVKLDTWSGGTNKPNQTQIKPNTNPIYKMRELNVSSFLTGNYKENAPGWLPKNKPNQTQNKSKRSADPYGQASWNPQTGDPISSFSLWDLEELRSIYGLCFTRIANRYKPRLPNKLQTRIWPVCTRAAAHLHRSATEATDSSGTVPKATALAASSSTIR